MTIIPKSESVIYSEIRGENMVTVETPKSTRKKAEPRYVKDADLGDKAHWAVIKIMIRRLCESSMI